MLPTQLADWPKHVVLYVHVVGRMSPTWHQTNAICFLYASSCSATFHKRLSSIVVYRCYSTQDQTSPTTCTGPGIMCMQRASPLPGNTHIEPECIESLVCPRTERACTQPLLLGKGTIELIQIPLGTQHVFCQVTFSLNHWRLSLAAQATISSCTNNSCPFCSSSLLILMLLKLSQLFLEPLRPK